MIEAREDFEVKFGPTEGLTDTPTHYCPGCEHGILTHLIGDTLASLKIHRKTVMVNSVGCSVIAYNYFNCDHIQSPHGRAPAVMAGIKRVHPELITYSIQGDGDGLAIGLLETMYAAIRGEPITIFLVNNAIYGMTGGQMAPTTLKDQVTTTTPYGRNTDYTGEPLDICKILSTIEKAAYVRRGVLAITRVETPRGAVYHAKNVLEARKLVENAFRVQMLGGFSLVEFLGSCNVNWRMSILDAKRFVQESMVRQYPPGVYRDTFHIEQESRIER